MVGVVQEHPELLAGAFDVDSTLYQALDDGELLFGINQQGYLQGYWPVVLLTWFDYTQEALINNQILTGPAFVTQSPSDAEQTCLDNLFTTDCEATTTPTVTPGTPTSAPSGATDGGGSGSGALSLDLVAAALGIASLFV